MSEVRNAFHRERVTTPSGKHSRTKQAPASQCDVNAIIRRWQSTGVLDHLNKRVPRYGDFLTADDYLGALTSIQEAQAAFEALPSDVRSRCGNDPGAFLEFVADPANAEELRSLGLVELLEEPPVVPVEVPSEVVSPPPDAPAVEAAKAVKPIPS